MKKIILLNYKSIKAVCLYVVDVRLDIVKDPLVGDLLLLFQLCLTRDRWR